MKKWDTNLLAWALRRRGLAFTWGQTDCAILCAEAHDLIAGSAIADQWRGIYFTEFGARRAMVKFDTDLAQELRKAGCVEVVPGFHRRGDFLLFGDRWVFGHVCLGKQCLSADPEAGVVLVNTAALLDQGCYVLRPSCLH